jgi:Big-like domain-containing protein
MASRGMKQPIPFLLFGLLLVPSAPVPGRTLVSVPATDTPLTFEPPPNGIVVAAGATLNTRLEPIEAQTPPGDESNRDPRLRIDSPRDGAVVAPGDTLQVTVSSPNRTRFIDIVIIMEDPFDTADLGATSLPAHFAIKIPKDISPGSYTVSAMAGLAGRAGEDGEMVVAVIEVDVERREMPRAIRLGRVGSTPPQLNFEKKGQTRDIELFGDFGDSDFVDLTESSRVTFESSDAAVATVDKSGTVTAVGPGRAAVVAWYGPRDRGIKASMPVEVR